MASALASLAPREHAGMRAQKFGEPLSSPNRCAHARDGLAGANRADAATLCTARGREARRSLYL